MNFLKIAFSTAHLNFSDLAKTHNGQAQPGTHKPTKRGTKPPRWEKSPGAYTTPSFFFFAVSVRRFLPGRVNFPAPRNLRETRNYRKARIQKACFCTPPEIITGGYFPGMGGIFIPGGEAEMFALTVSTSVDFPVLSAPFRS